MTVSVCGAFAGYNFLFMRAYYYFFDIQIWLHSMDVRMCVRRTLE